jgi:hypothetical protein
MWSIGNIGGADVCMALLVISGAMLRSSLAGR